MKLNELICSNSGVSTDVIKKIEEMTFVGIDFGTSTTTVTRLVYDPDLNQLVSDPLKIAQEDICGIEEYDHLVPSVIAMVKDGHLIFGSGAKECLLNDDLYTEGTNIWTVYKMRLGEEACYPHTRMSSFNTPQPDVIIETPHDAVRHFFAYLKKAIEAAVEQDGLPKDVRYAITVPASFAPNQREDLCSAIREAGLAVKDEAILDEPNSAFIGATGFYAEMGIQAAFFQNGVSAKVLVFDFGAGTCDVSIIQVMRDGRIKNCAISHFVALGGRDIDERIAENYFYPQLIDGRDGEDIPVSRIKNDIINKLKPLAEQAKISICKKFSSDYGEPAFGMVEANPKWTVEFDFSYPTAIYGVLSGKLKLTAEQFAEIMQSYTMDAMQAFDLGEKSIFDPIDNVMRKIGATKDDIDFVLMVGGSSKNPFVKQKLEEFFPMRDQVIIPGDSQTLVARGAAIHSFAVNGLGKGFIIPITADDIRIETQSEPVTIFPHGTELPSSWRQIDGLYIGEHDCDDGGFGIPFFMGSPDRRMGVVRFDIDIADQDTDVQLRCRILADKELEYELKIPGDTICGKLEFPVSSERVSKDDVEFIRAKNRLDRHALSKHGTPSVGEYLKVAKLAVKLNKHEEAADIYHILMYDYRDEHYERELADQFRLAGKRADSLLWFKKSYKQTNSSYDLWYIIWNSVAVNGWSAKETSYWVKEALAKYPGDLDFNYVNMQFLDGCGRKEEAMEEAQELCNGWEAEGLENINKYSLTRFEDVARRLGKRQLVQEIAKRENEIRSLESSSEDDGESFKLIRTKFEGGNK